MENKIFFKESIKKTIENRTSVRTYDSNIIEEEVLIKLEKFIKNIKSPFSNNTRIEIINSKENLGAKNLGTYGVIKGTNYYIGIVGEVNDTILEDLGYRAEALVLYAKELNLGTCWLGGTFKKSSFAKLLNVQKDEIFPAVISIGYLKNKKRFIDGVVRYLAKSKQRKEWNELFYLMDFSMPLSKINNLGKFKEVLEAVRIAPSASNKQPWRIIKRHNNYHFFLKHTENYTEKLGFDIQKIDLGIAICHFDLMCNELNLEGSFKKIKHEIKNIPKDVEYIISWINKK